MKTASRININAGYHERNARQQSAKPDLNVLHVCYLLSPNIFQQGDVITRENSV
jgi:hypothetical protein